MLRRKTMGLIWNYQSTSKDNVECKVVREQYESQDACWSSPEQITPNCQLPPNWQDTTTCPCISNYSTCISGDDQPTIRAMIATITLLIVCSSGEFPAGPLWPALTPHQIAFVPAPDGGGGGGGGHCWLTTDWVCVIPPPIAGSLRITKSPKLNIGGAQIVNPLVLL